MRTVWPATCWCIAISICQTGISIAPNALLIYHDYNCHVPDKRQKLVRLLTELKARGVPVDVYGMQGRFDLGDRSLDQFQSRATFDALRELDLRVVVSELDSMLASTFANLRAFQGSRKTRLNKTVSSH